MTTNEQRPDEPFSPMQQARAASSTRSRWPDVGSVLGYSVSLVMTVVGGLVLAGYFVHAGVPDQFRWTFGIVLILMGLYRFVMTQMRRKQKELEREEEAP
jgi:uncharacterized membrane protein YfcA